MITTILYLYFSLGLITFITGSLVCYNELTVYDFLIGFIVCLLISPVVLAHAIYVMLKDFDSED